MAIQYYPDKSRIDESIKNDDPWLVLVSFCGERIIIGNIDDTFEHHILLKSAGYPETDLAQYFRIVVNKAGADWTFVCPSGYQNIRDRERRIEQFYKDGIDVISNALKEILYDEQINIPTRYRRHFNELGGND